MFRCFFLPYTIVMEWIHRHTRVLFITVLSFFAGIALSGYGWYVMLAKKMHARAGERSDTRIASADPMCDDAIQATAKDAKKNEDAALFISCGGFLE